MHKAMAYLMEQLERPVERKHGALVSNPLIHKINAFLRPIAFLAIGYVAEAVGSDMKQFLEPIMKQAVNGLTMKG